MVQLGGHQLVRTLHTYSLPTWYFQATHLPEWWAAITNDLNAFLKIQTWSLVLLPSTTKHTVGCKWGFKLKRKAYGSIECHKAWIVGRAFI